MIGSRRACIYRLAICRESSHYVRPEANRYGSVQMLVNGNCATCQSVPEACLSYLPQSVRDRQFYPAFTRCTQREAVVIALPSNPRSQKIFRRGIFFYPDMRASREPRRFSRGPRSSLWASPIYLISTSSARKKANFWRH